ncbi:MAG: ABC transporter permease [Actinomycetaceae bacterium]
MNNSSLANGLRNGSWQSRLTFSLSGWMTVGLLVLVVAVNASLQGNFFSEYSIMSNFATFAPLVFAAIAQSIVVISGGLDLSIGANLALSSVVALRVMEAENGGTMLGILAGLATGAACGLLNGVVVAVVRLQPLIATFATSNVFSGLALVVLPSPGGSVPSEITSLYRSIQVGIPFSVILVIIAALAWLVVSRTKLLRHIRAVGGDYEAAYTSLVPVVSTRLWTYTLAGLFVGAGAICLLANTGSGDAGVGANAALDSIAAVVVGGVALSGGRGTAIGAIAGVFILEIATNILSFLGVPTTWRDLLSGIIIIVALALSVLTARRDEKK